MPINKYTGVMLVAGFLLPAKGLKWKVVHHLSKPILLNSMGYLSAMLEDIIKEKKKNGWVNPEIELLYNNMTEVLEKDYPIEEKEDGKYDHIRRFYSSTRDVLCTILDEDSHYLLRFFYFIEILNRDYDKYNIEMHRNKVYWNWEIIMRGLTKDDPAWNKERLLEGFKNAKEMVSEQDRAIRTCPNCAFDLRSSNRGQFSNDKDS